jgi:hypothetical protein
VCNKLKIDEGHSMEPRLIGYNRRRHCAARARRWRIWVNITLADVRHGGQARLARQLGVHRSTICRDMKLYWQCVREGVPLPW